jgi:CAAX prenyl protease-like protein
MALGSALDWSPQLTVPLRFLIVAGLLVWLSRPYFSLRASHAWASAGLGIAVFLIWIAPDLLFGYRHHWIFENAITGAAATSLAPSLRHNVLFLICRAASAVLLVPIVEELFWRGWLMRWLVRDDFLNVPLGTFSAVPFCLVAILFASEHGPYWEVGLAAGIAYNWWMVRTRNLADCIVAHAITNACLSAYVLIGGQWQYWL